MKRLNGWQRLWIVGTVALGMYTIAFGVVTLDTKGSLLDKHERRINEYRSQIEAIKSRKDSTQPISTIDRILYGDDPSTKINELNTYIINLNNQLETDLKAATPALVKSSLVLLGLWLGASALTYLSGLTLNWIYRGFRPKSQD